MLNLYFIRHSITYGNTLGRYIGKGTDEGLAEEGITLAEKQEFPQVEMVFASPLKRCMQTAGICFPGLEIYSIEELAECDFGQFENKNHKELSDNPLYQNWIDSGGTLAFPDGESREAFGRRSCMGFERCITMCLSRGIKTAAIVAHGGTIMSVMERYAKPSQPYFAWQVKNVQGFHLLVEEEYWNQRIRQVSVIKKLDAGMTAGEDS